MGEDDVSRRTLLVTPALLAFAGTTALAQDLKASDGSARRTLIAYISRSGNTRVIAGSLYRELGHRELGADLFEISTAIPYPEDYEQHVARAKLERDQGLEPPLAAKVDRIARYDQVFLGFPIWGETVPAPIRTFLKMHDLRGKVLRPFITHGGYGPGNATDVLASHAVGARIEKPFVIEADQERRTLNQVRSWLGGIAVSPE